LPTLSVYFDVSMAVVQWVAAGLSVDDRRPGFEHGRGWAIGSGERKSTRWVSVSSVLARPRADLAPSCGRSSVSAFSKPPAACWCWLVLTGRGVAAIITS